MTTAPVDAGTYILKAEISECNNNDVASAEKVIVINTKEITITALPYTMTVGEKLSQDTDMVKISPVLADGDTLASVVLTPSISKITTNGNITPSNAVIKNGTKNKTANYAIEYNTGKLTIVGKDISVAVVTLDIPEEGYIFDNTEKKPAVTVALGGKTLVKDRDYSAVFNAAYYYKNNTDVANVYGKDEVVLLKHFINNGKAEGRVCR